MKRLFLGGKVDAVHGAWRDRILGRKTADAPYWALSAPPTIMEGQEESGGVIPWPERPFEFFGYTDGLYVGPYRQVITDPNYPTKWSGYFHGVEAIGQHGMLDRGGLFHVMQQCSAAIRKADLMFCVLNTTDCHGTLVEIGLAKAWGIPVHLVLTEDVNWEELQYAAEVCVPHLTYNAKDYDLTSAFAQAWEAVVRAPLYREG
jgi:hypothetical protein